MIGRDRPNYGSRSRATEVSLSLRLHAGLANGQVLQRDSQGEASVELHFTGIDASSSLIATLFDGHAVLQSWTFASPAADPSIRLDPISTGGPYDLRLENGSSTVTVRGFFVGEVWILAGQSNMEGWGLLAGAAPPHPRIRAFTMRREWTRAVEPMHLLAESPDVCHHGGTQCSAAESRTRRRQAVIGTGPGLFFAREMLERTGVPQGLVCCAHAGTSLTQWTPEPLIDGETSMYGSMLQSVQATAQPVAGVLWYQGESDATPDDAPAYTTRMGCLVTSLRRDLAQPRLPWIMVQLARRFGRRDPDEISSWNSVQDQQRLLPDRIPDLAMISAIDLPLEDEIHLAADAHATLAHRLADQATRLTTNPRRLPPPPTLHRISKSFAPDPASPTHLVIDVTYRHAIPPLTAPGEPNGFAVIDSDGVELPLIRRTTLRGRTVRLHTASTITGARIAYGYGCTPVCNITDARGLALPVFAPQALPTISDPQIKRIEPANKR